MSDRERFEIWINSIGADHDLYTTIEKEALWLSWQAALAQSDEAADTKLTSASSEINSIAAKLEDYMAFDKAVIADWCQYLISILRARQPVAAVGEVYDLVVRLRDPSLSELMLDNARYEAADAIEHLIAKLNQPGNNDFENHYGKHILWRDNHDKPLLREVWDIAQEMAILATQPVATVDEKQQPDDPRDLLCRFGKYLGEYWSNSDHAQYGQWPMEEFVKEFLAAENEKDGRK